MQGNPGIHLGYIYISIFILVQLIQFSPTRLSLEIASNLKLSWRYNMLQSTQGVLWCLMDMQCLSQNEVELGKMPGNVCDVEFGVSGINCDQLPLCYASGTHKTAKMQLLPEGRMKMIFSVQQLVWITG